MIEISSSNDDFKKVTAYLERIEEFDVARILKKYGRMGVNALSSATPKLTGKTASSWSYEINKSKNGCSVSWTNSNVNNGVNIAIILQYGHGTGTGGYVSGRDYINPALRDVFDKMAEEAWSEVTKV